MKDLQVDNLSADLDVVVGERLGAFGAADALHGTGLGLAANGDSAHASLIFEQFGYDGTG